MSRRALNRRSIFIDYLPVTSVVILFFITLFGVTLPKVVAQVGHECVSYQDVDLLMVIDHSSSMSSGNKMVKASTFGADLVRNIYGLNHLERLGYAYFCIDVPTLCWDPEQEIYFLCNWPLKDDYNFLAEAENIENGKDQICEPELDGTALHAAIKKGADELNSQQTNSLKLFVVITDGEESSIPVTTPYGVVWVEASYANYLITRQNAVDAIKRNDMVTFLIYVGSHSEKLDSIANDAGPTVFYYHADASELANYLDVIVGSICTNHRPKAAFEIRPSNEIRIGTDGCTLTLDASASRDIDPGDEISYEWIGLGSTDKINTIPLTEEVSGDFTIRLKVTDSKGESHIATQSVSIFRSSPELETGTNNVLTALDPIELSAHAVDPDNLCDGTNGIDGYHWEVTSAPAGGTYQVGADGWNASIVPALPTGENDITLLSNGNQIRDKYSFRCIVVDNEGKSTEKTEDVEIINQPAEVHVEVPLGVIPIGQGITLDASDSRDPDGGELSFHWTVLQAPEGGSLSPQSGSKLEISPGNALPGTWRFQLTITDNETEPVQPDEIVVTVDGPVVAVIDEIEQPFNTAQTLRLNSNNSYDEDAPCDLCPSGNCCHITEDGSPVDLGNNQGIIFREWFLVGIPPEWWYDHKYREGSVEDIFEVDGHSPELVLPPATLKTGDWTFQLEVRDDEGNIAWEEYTLTVVAPNARPFAIVNDPGRYNTDVTGYLPEPIKLDGTGSFDLDDVLAGEELVPGLGIKKYQWDIVKAPVGCDVTKTNLPREGAVVQLYDAGTYIDSECLGHYQLQLTVTDNDDPEPKTNTAANSVIIGNCGEPLCIDYPTTWDPEYVEFSDMTDIIIQYHLQSLLYDEMPQFGVIARLEVFHEDYPNHPVYTSEDPNVLASDKGGYLVFHWNGYYNWDTSGERPETGLYTIRISLLDYLLEQTLHVAEEEHAIMIEAISPVILTNSDSYLDFNRLDKEPDYAFYVFYDVSGNVFPDYINWEIVRGAETIFETERQPVADHLSWNGRDQTGTLVLEPDRYQICLTFYKDGKLMGEVCHDFTVIEVKIEMSENADTDKPMALFTGDAPEIVEISIQPESVTGDVILRAVGELAVLQLVEGETQIDIYNDGGVVYSPDEVTLKQFTLTALKGDSERVGLEVTLFPSDDENNSFAADLRELFAIEFRLASVVIPPERAENQELFLHRNPHAVASANFDAMQYLMHPLEIGFQEYPEEEDFEILLEPEVPFTTTTIQLYEAEGDHDLILLPASWRLADFDQNEKIVKKNIFVNSGASGEYALVLRCLVEGEEVRSRRIKFKVRTLPGLSGVPIGPPPYFIFKNTANIGDPKPVAVDPLILDDRVGLLAAVYVLPHRTPAQWAVDNSLTTAIGVPQVIAVSGSSIAQNITPISTPLPEGQYDIVLDFGNFTDDALAFSPDVKLDPGDLTDLFYTGQCSFEVLPNLDVAGTASVKTEEYGIAAPISTTTIPASYDGLVTTHNFRLRGRLVYPDPIPLGGLPLVVIAHGNHTPLMVETGSPPTWRRVSSDLTLDENYRGYKYLQEHLASYGYITLSVDLDEAHGPAGYGYPTITGAGIHIRANLVLRNIEEVLSNALIAGGDLVGKIQRDRVYLIGHSRGGEAVIVVNGLLAGAFPRPAGSSAFTLAPNHIKGVISVSPTSVEDAAVPATVPYFLIYGSADGDVNGATLETVWPFENYDNAQGAKFSVYAIGANHNYFNSSWPMSDANEELIPPNIFTGRIQSLTPPVGGHLLSRPQQEELLKCYALGFLRLYEEEQPSYQNHFVYPVSLSRPGGLDPNIPISVAFDNLSGFSEFVVDDFESEPSYILASSGTSIELTDIEGMAEESLRDLNLTVETEAFNRFFQATRGGIFHWTGPATYKYVFNPPLDLHGKYFTLRIAQQPKHPQTDALDDALDFAITVADEQGKKTTITASGWTTVREIYPSVVNTINTTKSVFQTFSFPWWAFTAENKDLDLSNIHEIYLDMNSTSSIVSPVGRIAIDNIEIWEK